MNSVESTLARWTAHYRHDAQALLAGSLRLLWWVHGGEPGSPSRTITVTGEEGVFTVTSHHVHFNFSADPAQQISELRLPLHSDTVRSLLDDMLGGVLFRQRFAEEDSHDMADARQERWELQLGQQALTKTFYEPFPNGLTLLRERFADCARAR